MLRKLWDWYRQWAYWKWVTGLIASLLGSLTALLGGMGVTHWINQRQDCPECSVDVTWTPPRQETWLTTIPWQWILGIGVPLTAVMLLTRIRMPNPHNEWDSDDGRDPRRLFTDADRRWIAKATDNRCENRRLFALVRCWRKAQQLDHWYPYAKGGATSRRNLDYMCAKCNNRKSDHTPTLWMTFMLKLARRRYWPDTPEYADGLVLDGRAGTVEPDDGGKTDAMGDDWLA